MTEWRILLVDDDPEDCQIVEEAVMDHTSGCIINYATDGVHALEVLEDHFSQQTMPDLILLDFNMPKMNGRETLETIKKDERYKHIPVLIYSTSINPHEKEKCIELGAHSFLKKPISLSESQQIATFLLSFKS